MFVFFLQDYVPGQSPILYICWENKTIACSCQLLPSLPLVGGKTVWHLRDHLNNFKPKSHQIKLSSSYLNSFNFCYQFKTFWRTPPAENKLLAFLEIKNKLTGMPIFTSSRTGMSYHHTTSEKYQQRRFVKRWKKEKTMLRRKIRTNTILSPCLYWKELNYWSGTVLSTLHLNTIHFRSYGRCEV